jgi:hypothetical protein
VEVVSAVENLKRMKEIFVVEFIPRKAEVRMGRSQQVHKFSDVKM